jgi:hypothetical protein
MTLPAGYDRSSLVVWAFHHPSIGRQDTLVAPVPIRFVTTPTASNANLRTQQRVFTFVDHDQLPRELGPATPFESILEDLARNGDPARGGDDFFLSHSRLIKFTMPASQADESLRLLWRLDITPSAIYPGYGGVIDDIKHEVR